MVYGSIYAILAIGIVLVYRGNRIINFAQAQVGIPAAILAIELNVTYNVNFVLSCLTGIAAAIVTGAILSLLPRHFRKSSRLILTVATIGLAQGLGGVSALLPILFCNPATNQSCTTAAAHQTFNTPLHFQFSISPVVFSGNDVVAFGGTVIIVVALALFMRRSKYGLAIRAASENGERATLLGVPVPRLDTIIWITVAVLSTVAILLQTPVLGFGGFQTVTTGSDDVLIRILAAAVIGRMESMPRTAIAAIAIGIFDAGRDLDLLEHDVSSTPPWCWSSSPPCCCSGRATAGWSRPTSRPGGRSRRCGRSRGPWPPSRRSMEPSGRQGRPDRTGRPAARCSSRTARPIWPDTSSSTPSWVCRSWS